MNPFDNFEYEPSTLELLATNLEDEDVLHIFQQVWRFRERGGYKKSYLPDWGIKRRRYDNAFLILEATKFITRNEKGSSTPYFPTIRGTQLALYLINDLQLDKDNFVKLTTEEYESFMHTYKLRDSTDKGDEQNA
ncbi:hypothetical protein [Paenibacillus sp. GP183]|uniref:hypothetical protein n=1 Tax=Paenibacillus sp. GP183 TaxID=1882751 RepID=UPI00089ABF43|nr:hypothetical protein [Paenibacillus sp. GP183]SED12526.1 hypothetical protein SAMN05443246_5817 [Paenibacillus sp. GP183]